MKRSIVFAIIGIVASIGCAAKEPFLKKESLEVSAKVEAIDSENRLLSLSGPVRHVDHPVRTRDRQLPADTGG